MDACIGMSSDGRDYYQCGYWTSIMCDMNNSCPYRSTSEAYDRSGKFYNEIVIQENKIYVFPIINGLHEGNWLSLGYTTFAR